MTDLQIDFMVDGERRTTSSFSLRRLLFLALLLIPTLVGIGVFSYMSKGARLSADVTAKRQELEELQGRLKAIEARNIESAPDVRLTHTIKGWVEATWPWTTTLSNLMVATPPNVQFTSLNIDRAQPFESGTSFVRVYTISLRGTAVAPAADESIRDIQAFFASGAITSIVERVSVQAHQDGAVVSTDRMFELTATTRPKVFHDTTK